MAEQVAMTLSDAQLGILKHALGVPDAKRAPKTFYRDHFVTGEGSIDHPICMELVALGLMQRRPSVALYGGDDLFNVNGRGEAIVREALRQLDRDYLGYPREARILAFDLANAAPDAMMAKLGRLLK